MNRRPFAAKPRATPRRPTTPEQQARPRSGSGVLHRIRRRLSWHRRPIAAVLTALAVLAGLQAMRPPPPAKAMVVTAAHDLSPGRVLTARDLEFRAFPVELVPAGAFRSVRHASGRALAGPARSGEPLTDRRVVGRSLLRSYGHGLVAAPVQLGDVSALGLVQVGDRVDVLAASTNDVPGPAPAETGPADLIARSAPVVAVPGAREDPAASRAASPSGASAVWPPASRTPAEGTALLLAVDRSTAAELARAAVSARLSINLR